MAGQSGTTYKKRQKELARLDRQREKVAKRQQKKLERQAGVRAPDEEPLDGLAPEERPQDGPTPDAPPAVRE